MVSLVILTTHLVYNSTLINKNINSIQYESEMMKRFLSYTKSISHNFTKDTIIITPSYLSWPSSFIKLFYSPEGLEFILSLEGWEKEYRNQSDNVFVFDYDYEKEGIRFNPEKGKVIDLTNKYRAGEKIKFLQ